jgi:hypothetical protein
VNSGDFFWFFFWGWGEGKGRGAANQSFLLGRISPNFDLKNNDFDLYKEFFIEKNGPNSPDFEPKRFQISRLF